jgi:hypothetical protein
MSHTILKTLTFASLAFAFSNVAFAGDAEDKVLSLVNQTYGIDKLKSISIYSDLRFGWVGQGYTPGYVELPQMVKDLKIDLVNQRGSEESWGGPLNNYNYRVFNTKGGIGHIDYGTKTYSIDEEGTYYRTFYGEIRSSDTLLAYELVKRPQDVVIKEQVSYLGMPHTVMTLSIPDWTPMDIFVNSTTGHITKMQRPSGYGTLRYQFGDFKKTSGVTYAADLDFYVGKFFSEYVKERRIKVNSVRASTWKVDRGLTLEGEKVVRDEMSVNVISDIIKNVGVNGGYTSFIDAGDHIIAVGGSSGFKARWDAYQAEQDTERGQSKPLKHFIVTHHHADHIAGIKEGYDLGANIIVTEMAAQSVKDLIGETLIESRIDIMGKQKMLGPVEIYDIATSHVGSLALVYVPKSKTAIQVDHYDNDFIVGPSPANRASVTLHAEIERLNLDVETLVSLHGRKPDTWETFLTAIAAYDPSPCPTKRPICR